MPALFETAVRPVMCGEDFTWAIRVSGTPERPKPPQRRVLFDGISAMADSALVYTLLISWRRMVEEKERERFRYVW
jgi:hypothetical protein